MNNFDDIREELEAIAIKNNGVLIPAAVVEFARDETTALHSRFNWDDTEAAQKYRLWQARQVIKVSVTVIENKSLPTYVSLKSDRETGGGYRFTADVMSEADMRRELLKEAKQRFDYWRKQYRTLNELQPVFEAMDRLNEAEQAELVMVTESAIA